MSETHLHLNNQGWGHGHGHSNFYPLLTHDMTKVQCAVYDEYGHIIYKCEELMKIKNMVKQKNVPNTKNDSISYKTNNINPQVNLIYCSPIVIDSGTT